MKVGLRIAELAAERGLDMQTLANQLSLDPQTMQNLASGQAVELDLTTLGHLAQMLGVLPNELVTEVVEPQESILDGAEPPRDIDVPVQTMGEVSKDPSDPFDAGSPAQRV